MAWNPFRRHSEVDLAALDRYRVLRKLAVDDVTDVGGRLAELNVDGLGDDPSHHARHALELHTRARETVRAAATVEDVLEHQDRLFHEQSSSHDGYKHLAQEEVARPGTRFGGGDGFEGGSRGNSHV